MGEGGPTTKKAKKAQKRERRTKEWALGKQQTRKEKETERLSKADREEAKT